MKNILSLRSPFTVLCLLFSMLLLPTFVNAQLALERDINREAASSNPDFFTELDGLLYFSADDGIHGVELFRYNLASGEAELVANVRPYDDSSYPTEITPFDGKIYFRAYDAFGSTPYLQVYDPADGSVNRLEGDNRQLVREPGNLFVFDGRLFFSAIFSGAGREPGYYDPAANKIVMLADINPNGNSSPSSFLNIEGKLWFSADDGESNSRLWYYDPVTDQVNKVLYDSPGGIYPNMNLMYHADGRLFFRGHIAGQGEELHIYDMVTNALIDIPQIYPGPASSSPGPFQTYDGKVYFPARTLAHGREVMFFDPTDNSVELLHDFNPQGNGDPSILEGPDSRLYITANVGSTDERKLFSYDTTEGVKELAILENDGLPNLLNPLISAGGKLFLYGQAVDVGTELFSFTPDDTDIRLAADINQTTIGSDPYQFTAYNGRLYFGADEPNYGREVWMYDPATGNTDLLTNSPGNTSPYGFTVLNNKLFFAGIYPDLGYGLLYYDDQTNNISPTSFITPSHTGHISEIIAYSGKLYFAARDDVFGKELFVYDPITEEASLLKDINPDGSSNPSNLFVFNDQLYFRADDGMAGAELWRYDDMTKETKMIADIAPGNESSSPDWFAAYNGQLYFSAYVPGSAYNLYSYDPVSESVTQRTDISGNLNPEYLCVFNNKLFFKGRLTPSAGNELLYYDVATGETETTTPLNSRGSNPAWLTVFNDKLYFAATTEAYGNELWAYTDDGTAIVADIRRGAPGSDPSWLTVFNNKLYFSANDGLKGTEVWSLAACINIFVDATPVYHPDSLGSIRLWIEGGQPPYTTSWSHGTNVQSPENLPPGEYTVTVTDASGCLSELTAVVPFIDTTDAPEIREENSFTVFPNPSDGHFTLQWGDLQPESVSIYDMQGRLVLYETVENHLQSVSLDLSQENTGMYFLQIQSKKGPVYKKLMIK